MAEQQRPVNTPNRRRGGRLSLGLLAILPLAILGVLIWAFIAVNPIATLVGNVPAIPELTVDRVELSDAGIVAHVTNAGPTATTVAQVLIDDAYWSFQISPSATIPRLGSATVTIPYPWVQNEPHELVLIAADGSTFSHEIELATTSPQPNLNFWLLFAAIGVYVGVIPVGLGLAWFPLLRRLSRRGMDFILALTVGLLVFLLVDTTLEGVEFAREVPDVFQAIPLVALAGFLSFLALVIVNRQGSRGDTGSRGGRLWLATSIAIGIGLHNLGEGMAIGAAISLGEVGLGAFLVIGFTLHNVTEGVGIGAPMSRDNPGLSRILGLIALAGAPAIVGTWIGGFAFSPLLAVVFLAIGAGAILQVVYEVSKLLLERAAAESASGLNWVNLGGLTAGILIMYVTAFLIA